MRSLLAYSLPTSLRLSISRSVLLVSPSFLLLSKVSLVRIVSLCRLEDGPNTFGRDGSLLKRVCRGGIAWCVSIYFASTPPDQSYRVNDRASNAPLRTRNELRTVRNVQHRPYQDLTAHYLTSIYDRSTAYLFHAQANHPAYP